MNHVAIQWRLKSALLSIVLALFAPGCGAAPQQPDPGQVGDGQLNQILESLRSAYKLPALAGFILEGDTVREMTAVGLRGSNGDEAVTAEDKWHIGSNTKAMTATLAGIYVKRGELDWDATLPTLLPHLAETMRSEYTMVTFEDLLTHRSGLPANDLEGYQLETRAELVAHALRLIPGNPVGEYLYSNTGYIIAGHVLEHIGGTDWETLIATELFQPLDMHQTGFGAPRGDAPWGHRERILGWQPVEPTARWADNPAVVGPAGTVHTTLSDYAKFLALHLAGARGEDRLLKAETIKTLHKPPEGFDYAMGWRTTERSWGDGAVLSHSGSNTMWYATAWVAPWKNFAVFAVTNAAGEGVDAAVDSACWTLIQRHLAAEKKEKPGASGDAPD